MRDAREADVWPNLEKRFSGLPSENVTAGGVTVDIARPCTVVGGRNGAGKSRVLRALSRELGERAIHIDLPAICEQSLRVLRGLKDVEDLKEAVGLMPMSPERRDDLQRIIGRNYDRIDWYGLDIEPGDADIADAFTWGAESDQPVTPYFEASYRTTDYTSVDMGLGEFSVHLLFWILQQYDHSDELIIIIDEPDAYLPPNAAAGLLARLLNICREHRNKGWRMILSTHSSDIIADAVSQNAFVYLDIAADGTTTATHITDDPSIAHVLLARPPIKRVLYVEDESALHLTTALIESLGRDASASTDVIWAHGSGDLVELSRHLPRPIRPKINYVLVFDGDQRSRPEIRPNEEHRWPAIFLPTEQDPDSLLASVRDLEKLATRLGRTFDDVARVLSSLEGRDSHDRVNVMADHFGRHLVLPALAALWVEENPLDAATFHDSLRSLFATGRRTGT